MNELAEVAALVLSHQRKVLEAADVLSEARVHLLASLAQESTGPEPDSASALRAAADRAARRSEELMHEALRLTATAERLVTEARAILGECGPVAVSCPEP